MWDLNPRTYVLEPKSNPLDQLGQFNATTNAVEMFRVLFNFKD